MDTTISVGHEALEIWPADQAVQLRGHETILMTEFKDKAAYHPGLIEEVLRRADDPERSQRLPGGLCGQKVYDIEKWNIPEARLIEERAKALFCHATATSEVVVDIGWASVYRGGDYCMPHSHLRTMASVVYFLDSGDTATSDSLDGRFCFVDPRIDQCCGEEAGRMTTPFMPPATPGTMILFPSQLVHCVNPYFGHKPRISLSWDIDKTRISGPQPPMIRPDN